RAEHRHHRVANELLHDAAEGLELVAHRSVVRRENCAYVLRVELLRARREADEVDEDDADDAALLPRFRLGLQRGAAGEAEPCDFRVFLAAGAAGHHSRMLAAFRLHSNGFADSGIFGFTQDTPSTEGDSP